MTNLRCNGTRERIPWQKNCQKGNIFIREFCYLNVIALNRFNAWLIKNTSEVEISENEDSFKIEMRQGIIISYSFILFTLHNVYKSQVIEFPRFNVKLLSHGLTSGSLSIRQLKSFSFSCLGRGLTIPSAFFF